MIFIYWLEEDPRYIKQLEPLFQQVESGHAQAVTSITSPLELLSTSNYQSETSRIEVQRFFQETPGLRVYEADWDISLTAAALRRQFRSLKTPDSLQLATALVSKAEVLYTKDQRLTAVSLPNLSIQTL